MSAYKNIRDRSKLPPKKPAEEPKEPTPLVTRIPTEKAYKEEVKAISI